MTIIPPQAPKQRCCRTRLAIHEEDTVGFNASPPPPGAAVFTVNNPLTRWNLLQVYNRLTPAAREAFRFYVQNFYTVGSA
jgi:hypothetical protein